MRRAWYSNEWKEGEGQLPTLTPNGKITNCNSENSVPIVLLGMVVDNSPRSDADAASGDQAPTASGDRKQDIPDWLQPLSEGLVEG